MNSSEESGRLTIVAPRALGALILNYVMTILIEKSIGQYVSLTVRRYLEMKPLLRLHTLVAPAIEVKMCMSSGRPFVAGKGITILKGCNTTMGAKPWVPDQVDILPKPPDKAM